MDAARSQRSPCCVHAAPSPQADCMLAAHSCNSTWGMDAARSWGKRLLTADRSASTGVCLSDHDSANVGGDDLHPGELGRFASKLRATGSQLPPRGPPAPVRACSHVAPAHGLLQRQSQPNRCQSLHLHDCCPVGCFREALMSVVACRGRCSRRSLHRAAHTQLAPLPCRTAGVKSAAWICSSQSVRTNCRRQGHMLSQHSAQNCPGCSKPLRCHDRVQAAAPQKNVHTAVHAMASLACCHAVDPPQGHKLRPR